MAFFVFIRFPDIDQDKIYFTILSRFKKCFQEG